MCHFHKHLNDEINSLGRVPVHLHEANAVGQEVHQEAEQGCYIVDLRGLSNATQCLQSGHDLLLYLLFLADLLEVLLVDDIEESLLQRLKDLVEEGGKEG